MKRFFSLLSLVILSLNTYSQSNNKNQFDLSGCLFTNSVIRFQAVDGFGSAENGEGLRFGIQYSRLIASRISINTGVGY
ncbi:MAG: hypothetical protein KAG95_06085 [Bacteroidales bacterium]|nr:hypothetical protein [Bacteroidales bacterium]